VLAGCRETGGLASPGRALDHRDRLGFGTSRKAVDDLVLDGQHVDRRERTHVLGHVRSGE
jgi:hypothetical protein